MSPNLDGTIIILMLVGVSTILGFHTLRRRFFSTTIYAALAAGFLTTVALGVLLRLRLHAEVTSWWDLLLALKIFLGITLYCLPAALLLGIPFWVYRRRKASVVREEKA